MAGNNEKPHNKKREFLQPGQLFAGRYLVLEKIGQGAYAEVYKAQDQHGQKQFVALKIIAIQDKNSEKQKQNLEIEKEAFAKLTFNKNVVGLKDFDSLDNVFYMVIDLVDGTTNFQSKFKYFYNLMSLAEIIYYFAQLAEGMNEIQLAGIIHRDIKPQNVMITETEIVKISDFGISKISDILKKDNPINIGFEGTPKYSAPEQYLSSGTFFPQSDIYSVGIMLYELATGIAPFDQYKDFKTDKEKYTYILNQHIKEEVVRPRVFNPNIPQSLDNIIMKCLAKEVKYRYQNFKDFLDDINHINENQNDKILEIPNNLIDKKTKKAIKKARDLRYDRFFKLFNGKMIATFFILLAILVVCLALLVLLS